MERGLFALIVTLCFIVDLTLYLVTLRAATGRIKRNFWVGIRTRTTRHSDDAWVAAHIAAYPIMRDTAAANALLLVIAMFLPFEFQGYLTQFALGVLVIGIVMGTLQAQKAAKATLEGPA